MATVSSDSGCAGDYVQCGGRYYQRDSRGGPCRQHHASERIPTTPADGCGVSGYAARDYAAVSSVQQHGARFAVPVEPGDWAACVCGDPVRFHFDCVGPDPRLTRTSRYLYPLPGLFNALQAMLFWTYRGGAEPITDDPTQNCAEATAANDQDLICVG